MKAANEVDLISKLHSTFKSITLSLSDVIYCNNYVEISGLYDNNLNVCYNMIMNNWCNSIRGALRSNVSALCYMIDIRDGVKECDSLVMFFLSLMILVSTNAYLVSSS